MTTQDKIKEQRVSSLPPLELNPRTFRIKLAGICIEIHQMNSGVRMFCRNYCCEDQPVFSLGASVDDLVEENEQAIKYFGCGLNSAKELEKLWLYREIAERLPRYDAFLMHASAISMDGRGFLFAGPSGTGKTTHINAWKKAFGERVEIINDDKPLIRVLKNEIRIFGSPWCGKERLNQNISAPLKGIIFLEQAEENSVELLSQSAAWERMMNQIYKSKESDVLKRTLTLTDQVIREIPIFLMKCNKTEEAAKMAHDILCHADD